MSNTPAHRFQLGARPKTPARAVGGTLPKPHVSALGVFIGMHPAVLVKERWMVVCYDSRGNYKSAKDCPDRNAAKKHRSELFKLHRKMAKKNR